MEIATSKDNLPPPDPAALAIIDNISTIQSVLAEFNTVEAAMADYEHRYGKVVFDMSTPKGFAAAKAGRKELKDARVAVGHNHTRGKAPVLAVGRNLDARKNYLTGRLSALEDPIDAQIKVKEEADRLAQEARLRAEAARRNAIRDKIATIREYATLAGQARDSERVAKLLQDVVPLKPDNSFAEFELEALDVYGGVLKSMQLSLQVRQNAEAEAARLAEQAKALAEQQAAHEKREREAKEQREQEQAELDAKREAFERDQAAWRLEQRPDPEPAKPAPPEFANLCNSTIPANQPQQPDQPYPPAPPPTVVLIDAPESTARAQAATETIAPVDPSASQVFDQAAAQERRARPSDFAIVMAVADTFGVEFDTAADWMQDMDLQTDVVAHWESEQ